MTMNWGRMNWPTNTQANLGAGLGLAGVPPNIQNWAQMRADAAALLAEIQAAGPGADLRTLLAGSTNPMANVILRWPGAVGSPERLLAAIAGQGAPAAGTPPVRPPASRPTPPGRAPASPSEAAPLVEGQLVYGASAPAGITLAQRIAAAGVGTNLAARQARLRQLMGGGAALAGIKSVMGG